MMKNKRIIAFLLSTMMILAYVPSVNFAKGLADVPDVNIDGSGVLTWGAVPSGEDGVGPKEYRLALQRRNIGGSNFTFNNTVTGGGFTNGKRTILATKPRTLNLKQILENANAAEGEWSVKIYAVKPGGAQMSNVTLASGFVVKGPAAGKLKKINAVASTFPNNGKVNIKLAAAGVEPTLYEVKLYRNTTALAPGANQVPPSATFIKEFTSTSRTIDVSEYVKYVKPGGSDPNNYFFVTAKAKRPGFEDTDMVFIRRTNFLAPPTIVNPAVDFASNGEVKITNNDYYKLTLQMYKRIGSGSPTKEGSPKVVKDYKKNKVIDMSEHMNSFGANYYVGVIAESKAGAISKEIYSDSLQLKNKTVAPASVAWEKVGGNTTGKVIVNEGTPSGKYVGAITFKATLFKNGVNIGESTVAAMPTTIINFAAIINALPGGDVKNLSGYRVQVVGKAPGALNSDPTETGEGVSAPDQASWNMAVNTDAIATWTNVEGADGYEVTLIDVVTAKEVKKVNLSGNVTEVSLADYMETGKNYKFKVSAIKGKFKSAATMSVMPHKMINDRLVSPENLQWERSVAKWQPVAGAAGYELQLFRNGKAFGDVKKVSEDKLDLSKNMNRTGEYTFRVKALSSTPGTVHSKYSVESPAQGINRILGKAVGKVRNIKASAGKYHIKLKWSSVKNANRYKVFMKKSGKYRKIGTTGYTGFTVRKLKRGRTYRFKIRAYRFRGNTIKRGPLSDVKTVRTKR